MMTWFQRSGILLWCGALSALSAEAPADLRRFLDRHCFECHDADTQKGKLDLSRLAWDLGNPTNFSRWVLIHDRTANGEMPPPKKSRPSSTDRASFLGPLNTQLSRIDQQRTDREGRAVQRRLNRYEYENVLRDLLDAPGCRSGFASGGR